MAEELRKFTVEELKEYDGQNGKPVYVAYEDKVIDVSASKLWKNGQHMRLHHAGEDLTLELAKAPHDASVLGRFPQVGILLREKVEAPEESAFRQAVDRFLDRYPFFRRHPHPMTVHFPIVFMIAAPVFMVLYLLTGRKGFEITGLNCLAGGLLFCLVAIPTGLITWWLNYMARPMPGVIIKISVSSTMFVIGLVAFIWRLTEPRIADAFAGAGVVYFVMIFALLPMVSVVGWYGAKMTFPLHSSNKKSSDSASPGASG